MPRKRVSRRGLAARLAYSQMRGKEDGGSESEDQASMVSGDEKPSDDERRGGSGSKDDNGSGEDRGASVPVEEGNTGSARAPVPVRKFGDDEKPDTPELTNEDRPAPAQKRARFGSVDESLPAAVAAANKKPTNRNRPGNPVPTTAPVGTTSNTATAAPPSTVNSSAAALQARLAQAGYALDDVATDEDEEDDDEPMAQRAEGAGAAIAFAGKRGRGRGGRGGRGGSRRGGRGGRTRGGFAGGGTSELQPAAVKSRRTSVATWGPALLGLPSKADGPDLDIVWDCCGDNALRYTLSAIADSGCDFTEWTSFQLKENTLYFESPLLYVHMHTQAATSLSAASLSATLTSLQSDASPAQQQLVLPQYYTSSALHACVKPPPAVATVGGKRGRAAKPAYMDIQLTRRFELCREPDSGEFDTYRWSEIPNAALYNVELMSRQAIPLTPAQPQEETLAGIVDTKSAGAKVIPSSVTPLWEAERITCKQHIIPLRVVPATYTSAGLSTAAGKAADKQPSMRVPQALPLHTRLDWDELVWDNTGVTIRGVRYDLLCMRCLPNTRYIRPPPTSTLPLYDAIKRAVVTTERD